MMRTFLLSCTLLLLPISTFAIDHWVVNSVQGADDHMICPGDDGDDLTITFYALDAITGDPLTDLTIDVWLEDNASSQSVFFCGSGSRTSPTVRAQHIMSGQYQASLGAVAGGASCGDQDLLLVFEATKPNPNGWVELEWASVFVNSPDLDGDLDVDLSDLILYSQAVQGGYSPCIDFDHNGSINLSDTTIRAQHSTHTCP